MCVALVLLLTFGLLSPSQAADPQLEIETMHKLMSAENQLVRDCEQLREHKSCRGLAPDFVATIGQGLDTCHLSYSAHNCDAYLLQHPKLQAQRNRCDSDDVCRNLTRKGFAEGCKDYGIEVGSSVLQSLKKLNAGCDKGLWQGVCAGGNAVSGVASTFWYYAFHPLILQLPKVPSKVSEAYEKYQKTFACLDSRAQQKLACYLAVQAGTAFVGVGLAAAKYANFAEEMTAAYEEAPAAVAVRKAAPALVKLDPDEILAARSSAAAGFETQVLEDAHVTVNGARAQVDKIVRKSDGRLVGQISWEVDRTGKNLSIEHLDAKIPGKGFSQNLLDFVLARNPKVQVIHGELLEDNFDAFIDARHAGLPCLDALKRTPAYKIRARAGFGRILGSSCSEEHGHLDMAVGR